MATISGRWIPRQHAGEPVPPDMLTNGQRRRRIRQVQCNKNGCDAAPGELCRDTATGRYMQAVHPVREERAKRTGMITGDADRKWLTRIRDSERERRKAWRNQR